MDNWVIFFNFFLLFPHELLFVVYKFPPPSFQSHKIEKYLLKP